MAHKDFSEKKMENVISQANEWFAAFKESTQFKELSTSAQGHSGVVTMALSEWMYKEELRAGREWTAATLENILVNVFPREVSEYPEVASDISSILSHYFTFLKEDKKIGNADTLLRKLAKLSFDSEQTEHPLKGEKSQGTTQKATKKELSTNYSQSEIAQFNRFAMGNKVNEVKEPVVEVTPAEEQTEVIDIKSKIGRNEQCPCGSGKKFKKCHGK
ncbi:SEC-C domain-containing protein [Vagococcus sp. BWB3-3]|uniref:SEC-C domain-containing protein n=1 Tax=Vagococcus allomyrinae TaxID=2794353 RepID=A0A940PI91_9ENTE|nr:SEC-C domain-containing protein [Vagococcus allomyrinae]MBP1044076.1 SEC-C domain-containing protein [Vagococcus allomyrinae]